MFNRAKKKSSSPQKEGNDKKVKWQPSTNKVLRAINPNLLISSFSGKGVSSKTSKDEAETAGINTKVNVGSTKKK